MCGIAKLGMHIRTTRSFATTSHVRCARYAKPAPQHHLNTTEGVWKDIVDAKHINSGDHVYFTIKRAASPNLRLVVVSTVGFKNMPDDQRFVAIVAKRTTKRPRAVERQPTVGTGTPSPTDGGARAMIAADGLMGACVMRVC